MNLMSPWRRQPSGCSAEIMFFDRIINPEIDPTAHLDPGVLQAVVNGHSLPVKHGGGKKKKNAAVRRRHGLRVGKGANATPTWGP